MDYPFPSFKNPPLNEVSIGLQFQPLEQLKIPHFGLFWNSIRDEYPIVEHASPIINNVNGQNEILPLPRIWFLNKNNTKLLQLQGNRINFNWRFRKEGDAYPRFAEIAPEFYELLGRFEKFLQINNIGLISPTVAELTYVNLFEQGREWNSIEDLSVIFKDFNWAPKNDRFLPNPMNISWAASYPLPEGKGSLNTRLNQVVRPADKENKQMLLQLDMLATYAVKDITIGSLLPWYDIAHEWIVKGFTDLTHIKIQKQIWERYE